MFKKDFHDNTREAHDKPNNPNQEYIQEMECVSNAETESSEVDDVKIWVPHLMKL